MMRQHLKHSDMSVTDSVTDNFDSLCRQGGQKEQKLKLKPRDQLAAVCSGRL
jgi:hypothetical protein